MNQTRLLKLSKDKREEYIRTELGKWKNSQLKRFVREYGITHTREMSKAELIDIIVEGLSAWAEKELNAIYV